MAQHKNRKDVARIVDHIKHNIIFGRLRPRERLIEEDITAQFDVSRHVVRAAMSELDQLGLITRRPNKGVIVRDFSVTEVDQIYEVRVLLQNEAIRKMPFPARKDLMDRLDDIHQRYCRAHTAGQLQTVCTLNNEFHTTIWAASGNDFLVSLIDQIWTQTLGIRCYGIGDPKLLSVARREHGEMIELLRTGDREAFIVLANAHMQPALEAYKRAHGGWERVASTPQPDPGPESEPKMRNRG